MSHATEELPYIDKEIILRSRLDDRVKQAYIDRIEDLDSKFRSVRTYSLSDDDPYDLPGCTEWRSLSVRFYRDTGTEGELETLWPPGWEKEYKIDLGLGDYPTAVKQELLDMTAMNAEVDAVAAHIRAEDKQKADDKGGNEIKVAQRKILPIRKRRNNTARLAKTE